MVDRIGEVLPLKLSYSSHERVLVNRRDRTKPIRIPTVRKMKLSIVLLPSLDPNGENSNIALVSHTQIGADLGVLGVTLDKRVQA